MAGIFEALSHPTRRRILEMLADGPRSAGDLAEAFEVSKPTMSNHFAKLRASGLVRSERRGTSIVYAIDLDRISQGLQEFLGRLGR